MSSSLLTTMKAYYKTFLPLVAAAASSPSNPTTTANPPSIPRLSAQQIRTASSKFDLHAILLESNGVLRIAYDEPGQADVRRNALENLCACPTFGPARFEEAAKLHPKDLQEIIFPDGAARRTLASATVGFDEASVLELPSWLKDECGLAALQSFEDLRDIVADVVDLFVDRLDQESGGELHGIGVESKTYRGLLSHANHLEHFHAYTKPAVDGVDRSDVTLDYHTDAGFFLSFVPAMDCDSFTTDNNSFYLKGSGEPVVFEDDEVVIMIGAGAQYWLNPERTSGEFNENSPFVAASHALRLEPNTQRSWYGKMHLLPSSLSAPSESVKYGDILPSLKLENYKAHVPPAPVDGCGTTLFNDDIFPVAAASPIRTSRRRLQHVNSPANCNNVTNFFCWHQCVAIPESENAEAYVYDGYSLYCLDPSKLGSEDPVKDAADPCENGFVHNSACKGSWQVTDPDVPGYPLPYKVASESKESEGEVDSSKLAYGPPDWEEMYCYGGTSMYMDGFTWQGTTCVIFLFRSWVLTTPGQFAAACFGTILFGIALEVVLYKRKAVYAMEPGNLRLCLSVLVYALQLSMGYFIMLIIMTYSGPLFVCTVGGLMIGHVIFNAQDSYMRRRDESIAEDEDCPCTTEDTGTEKTNELLSYQNSTPEPTLHNSTSLSTSEEYEDCCGGAAPEEPGNIAQDHSPGRGAIKRATKKRSKSKVAVNDDGATPCCRFDM